MNDTRKLELKNQSLRERLSNTVGRYEDEIADLRADATMMLEQLNARIAQLESQLGEKNGSVQEEE